MNRIGDLLQRSIWIGPLIGLIVGLGLGLLIGWVVAPVNYQLSADDVVAIADSYALNASADLAKARMASLSKDDQARILSTLIQDRTTKGLAREADRLTALAQALNVTVRATSPSAATPSASATRAPTPGSPNAGISLNNLLPLIAIVAVAFVILIAGIILVPRLLPELRARAARATPANAKTAPATAAPAKATAPPKPGGLGRYVAAYTLGNDNYDTSFSLETAKQEFLGECGMGISEIIGEGKPDKVTAFDVWLFDKGDVRTVTQILMSEYAFNDPALRAKLASKGDAMLAEKGKTLRLETQSLAVEVQIVELVYASNPNIAANSHFQKLTVEMVPLLKTG
ncbi:MAG: hypothetical protein HY327_07535 [Chloroflexi bacterium]|nr:hypothetical protein [Chloroflexota bacterium]